MFTPVVGAAAKTFSVHLRDFSTDRGNNTNRIRHRCPNDHGQIGKRVLLIGEITLRFGFGIEASRSDITDDADNLTDKIIADSNADPFAERIRIRKEAARKGIIYHHHFWGS